MIGKDSSDISSSIDSVSEYQQCQQIITFLRGKKIGVSTHQINRNLNIPDSKMIMRRKRFQDYFIRNNTNGNIFSLNEKLLQPIGYTLPIHPALIPIHPLQVPNNDGEQKLIIQYHHDEKAPYISYLPLTAVTSEILGNTRWVTLDLEGFNEDNTDYSLVQLSMNHSTALLFDHLQGKEKIHQLLLSILVQSSIVEMIFLHDCTCDVRALSRSFIETIYGMREEEDDDSKEGKGIGRTIEKNFIDTQLIFEYFTNELYGGFTRVLQYFSPDSNHNSKNEIGRQMKEDDNFWLTRDLKAHQIHYAAMDVLLLYQAIPNLLQKISEKSQELGFDLLKVLITATRKRIDYIFQTEERYIVFHPKQYYPITLELVEALAEVSTADSIYYQILQNYQQSIQSHCDILSLLPFFPVQYHPLLAEAADNSNIEKIHLAVGEAPTFSFFDEKSEVNFPNYDLKQKSLPSLTQDEYDHLLQGLKSLGLLEESSSTNKKSDSQPKQQAEVILRSVAVEGIKIIPDLLLHSDHENKSVLILGQTNEHRSTLLRDIAKALSSNHSVLYLDTYNELEGKDKSIIGNARRVAVDSTLKQDDIVIASCKIFKPNVIIIDDITSIQDTHAIAYCKQAGIRIIAGLNHSFRALVSFHEEYNLLVGGIELVPPPDEGLLEKRGGFYNKGPHQRRTEALFDTVLEMNPSEYRNAFRVFKDVAKTVDVILQYGKGKGELRQAILTKYSNDSVLLPSRYSKSSDSLWIKIAYHFIKI